MSKSDMLRITISNEYKQKRTALADFSRHGLPSPSRRVQAHVVEAVAEGGKSVFDRKRVKFREGVSFITSASACSKNV